MYYTIIYLCKAGTKSLREINLAGGTVTVYDADFDLR